MAGKKATVIAGVVAGLLVSTVVLAGNASGVETPFPLPLNVYQNSSQLGIGTVLWQRIRQQPMNLTVSLFFLTAVIHTFCIGYFQKKADMLEKAYHLRNGSAAGQRAGTCFSAEMLRLLAEVEIVFAVWVIPVFWFMVCGFGWDGALGYISSVNFTEPMFVVVIMILASSRPIGYFSESCMRLAARIGRGSTAAWWFVVLTIGPLLGSFITEPGAMTISAMLLAKHFYRKRPSKGFAYATIGLLFVNVSVGGTLSHFAAPPVLMVAGKWNWDTWTMLSQFGWKAALGIVISNTIYFVIFRHELRRMSGDAAGGDHCGLSAEESNRERIPVPVVLVHLLLMGWTVVTSHHPVLFIPGLFLFLGFSKATARWQSEPRIKPPLMVGAFLAGLVVHGGLQAWWIAPILSGLGDVTLMIGATCLTAFNDNAAIAYLSTLVPNLTKSMKYSVIAGAVTGGGLTVIANAPNPAGVSILRDYFEYGVSPAWLALGALTPTIILGSAFMLLP